MKKDVAGYKGRTPGQGVGGQSPLKNETLLAFRRVMEAANLPAFLNLETQKNLQISAFSC